MHDFTRHPLALAAALLAAVTFHVPALAQDLGVAAHGGTRGLGADVVLAVQPNVGVRASFSFFPFGANFTERNIRYHLEMPSPQVALLADFYPSGQFRLTGGVLIKWSDFDVRARLLRPDSIGDAVYTPAEVGHVRGKVTTHDVSPYIGIGFGDPTARRIGFFLDFGVAFHGNPKASARADGPIGSDPEFQQNLEVEVQQIQDDIDNVIVYPVLSLGISFRVGPPVD